MGPYLVAFIPSRSSSEGPDSEMAPSYGTCQIKLLPRASIPERRITQKVDRTHAWRSTIQTFATGSVAQQTPAGADNPFSRPHPRTLSPRLLASYQFTAVLAVDDN